MITRDNYLDEIGKHDLASMGQEIEAGHAYLLKATDNGRDWDMYYESEKIRETIDLYLTNLNDEIKRSAKPGKQPTAPKAAKGGDMPEKLSLTTQSGDKLEFIGWNGHGQHIYLDPRGVRHLRDEEGVIMSHPVRMGPHGTRIPKDESEMREEYRLSVAYQPAKATKRKPTKPAPDCKPAKPKQQEKPNAKPTKAAEKEPKPAKAKQKSNPAKAPKSSVELVRDMDVELRLMNRFRSLHSKPKTFAQVLSVLNAINRAVGKGQIRKTHNPTKYHKEIEWIQGKLVDALETAYSGKDPNEAKRLEFDGPTIERLKSIWAGYQVYPSVRLGLRYFAMEGRSPETANAEKLLDEIKRAEGNGRIAKDDPNAAFLRKVAASLQDYVDGKTSTVRIHEAVLSGLAGAVLGCPCQDRRKGGGAVNGYGQTTYRIIDNFEDEEPDDRNSLWDDDDDDEDDDDDDDQPAAPRSGGYIIAPPKGKPISFQASQMPTSHDDTYEFTGRWAQLFGSPIKGFSAMIFGKPKSGKSTLAVDFAGYLAKSFGNVLYASIEEGARGTITERISRLGAGHPRLTVTNHLPANLAAYKFVIVDSVSRGQMDIDELRKLIARWPQITFIFIFHVTKDGLPRGTSEFQHEVDVIVEVKDGVANAVGRFGPGEAKVRFN